MPKKSGSSVGAKADSGLITVTAQQSRFHVDANETPKLKDIDIRDLSIAIGQRDILQRANLVLREGFKYVLIGRNGVGKSTLLKAIGEGMIPGIPSGFKILLLGQTRDTTLEESMEKATLGEKTVLEHVMRSDKVREQCLKESKMLTEAFDNTKDGSLPIKALRKIMHERLEHEVAEARQIATRRSGMRGLKARKELVIMEEKLAQSQESLEEDLSGLDAAQVTKETEEASELLGDVQARLELMEAESAESRARTVLLGLGFPPESIDKPMYNLSGGWRTRTELACALFSGSTDVLLLDEPSNFLDLPSIIWLQRYITELENTTVVVTTHDRDFADAVAQELIVMRELGLERFRGNLSLYESERYKSFRHMTKYKENVDKQKKQLTNQIQRFQTAARRSGDDKKLKQAKSREKKLEDRTGMEKNSKGHRFKRNADENSGYWLKSRQDIEVPKFDPPVTIDIPTQPPDLRFPGALVSLDKVCFSYDPKKKSSPEILTEIDLNIHYGHRYGLAGLNGSGKTTLVSLVVGTAEGNVQKAALPTKGNITRHARVKIGRFSQHVVEELEAYAAQNKGVTALQELLAASTAAGDKVWSEQEARGLLSSVGLQGSTVSDVPIAALSGGQKVRLALAKILVAPPHLLVLDEITTHLDSDTITALARALRHYEGAILVVTHDRFFMRCVVEGEKATSRGLTGMTGADDDDDEEEEDSSSSEEEGIVRKGTVYRLVRGRLKLCERGMRQYEEIATRQSKKLTAGIGGK